MKSQFYSKTVNKTTTASIHFDQTIRLAWHSSGNIKVSILRSWNHSKMLKDQNQFTNITTADFWKYVFELYKSTLQRMRSFLLWTIFSQCIMKKVFQHNGPLNGGFIMYGCEFLNFGSSPALYQWKLELVRFRPKYWKFRHNGSNRVVVNSCSYEIDVIRRNVYL